MSTLENRHSGKYISNIMYYKICSFVLKRKYLLDKPKGVRGRSSDNQKILKELNWAPSISLKHGLEKTYKWIFNQISSGENTKKFTRF